MLGTFETGGGRGVQTVADGSSPTVFHQRTHLLSLPKVIRPASSGVVYFTPLGAKLCGSCTSYKHMQYFPLQEVRSCGLFRWEVPFGAGIKTQCIQVMFFPGLIVQKAGTEQMKVVIVTSVGGRSWNGRRERGEVRSGAKYRVPPTRGPASAVRIASLAGPSFHCRLQTPSRFFLTSIQSVFARRDFVRAKRR